MPVKNHQKIKVRDYAATWKGISLGWLVDVDISGFKPKYLEKKIEEIGDITVDHVLIGYEGTIKATLKQVTVETYRQLIHAAPVSGPIPLSPALQYASCYDAAGLLNLHPRDMGVVLTDDFNLLKAFPILTFPKSSQGKEWQNIPVEFQCYPDLALLTTDDPTLAYGYVGAPPA